MTKTMSELPEQDYRYLFENASDAIWVHDMDGHIVYANKAAEKLTGYSKEDLIGLNIIKFLGGDESHDIAREVRRRLLKNEEIEQPYEQSIVRKDGRVAIVKMATSLLISNGKVTGFQHIARDETKERHLQENMRFYVQEVIRAQEDERKRIAREIHDDVSPSLLLLIQRIDAISSGQRPKPSDTIKQKLEGLRCQSVEALESLRRIAQDLRPRILDDLGLIAALEWMADDLIKNHGIETQVEVLGKEESLPSEVQMLLFRIAQEALNNVRKHADAAMAQVTMEFAEEEIKLTIRDNGKGFERPKGIGDMAASGKLRLAGMQERAQLMGGQLEITSAPGKGTTISACLPTQGNLCHLTLTPSQKGLRSILDDMGIEAKG